MMCESVRDEIKLNMGTSCSSETARQLLLAMCKGRLQPTTWLEKVRNHVLASFKPSCVPRGVWDK